MKVKIDNSEKLSPEQKRFVNFHSIYNILNIIHSSISYIALQYDKNDILAPSKAVCAELIQSLEELSNPNFTFKSFIKNKRLVKQNIQEAVKAYPELKKDKIFPIYIKNIDSIFDVLDLRVKEAVQIFDDPKQWVPTTKVEIISHLEHFLKAVERNSFGKYKIALNEKRKSVNDYQVNFNIECTNSDTFLVPILLNDIIRDTVANSRKYTKTGIIINIQLKINDNKIVYSIEDFGIGIAPDEIQKVVRYGERGKNAKQIKTFGGGHGLTKVAMIMDYLSGKMWIDSKVGEGTTITLEIPVPKK